MTTAGALVRWLFAFALFTSVSLDHRPAAAESSRPNVILIYTDDQRADTLGVSGHPYIRTPHLDRLAREGAYFENAFVVTSLCCPSRASVLTGQHTHRTRVSHNGLDLDYASDPTLPALLREAGYVTAFFGKYHLGGSCAQREIFDHWECMRFSDGQGKYFDAVMNVDGDLVATQGYSTDVLASRASAWIFAHSRHPFFVILSLKNAHAPMLPPPRHKDLYADLPISPPASFSLDVSTLPTFVRSKPINRRLLSVVSRKWSDTPTLVVELIRSYARMIPSIDDTVGQIRATLKASGLLDRTVILFSSDNGFMLGEHGVIRKGLAYESSIRVPLVVRFPPEVPAGKRVEQQVLNIDVAPSILELVGLASPRQTDGRSFVPLLRDDASGWRKSWLYVAPYTSGQSPPLLALRSERWKYVRYAAPADEQLFDLSSDPGEVANLADDPRALEQLRKLRSALEDHGDALGIPETWIREKGGAGLDTRPPPER